MGVRLVLVLKGEGAGARPDVLREVGRKGAFKKIISLVSVRVG